MKQRAVQVEPRSTPAEGGQSRKAQGGGSQRLSAHLVGDRQRPGMRGRGMFTAPAPNLLKCQVDCQVVKGEMSHSCSPAASTMQKHPPPGCAYIYSWSLLPLVFGLWPL